MIALELVLSYFDSVFEVASHDLVKPTITVLVTFELEREEFGIKKRIGSLREEIASIERNMSFFAMSKTAEKMLKDFEVKIEKTKKQIDKLKVELSAIKKAKRDDTSADSEPSTEASAE